jgi:hypothetical protein
MEGRVPITWIFFTIVSGEGTEHRYKEVLSYREKRGKCIPSPDFRKLPFREAVPTYSVLSPLPIEGTIRSLGKDHPVSSVLPPRSPRLRG